MADQLTDVKFDEINLWNIQSLKDFCRKKGLRVNGSKQELVARVFAGLEFDLPDKTTKDEELRLKARSYQSLLYAGGIKLPDPFSELTVGWINENNGRKSWPPTMYCDICEYFHNLSGDINKSITKKALNDYKEGKAYSYFDSQWLKEVFYHPLSDESKYCFLKAMCSPSQRIHHTPHNVWLTLVKKTGEIVSAYCTCFAGLGATCNHVAAVLFKMDYYWRQGLTNKACTDTICSWNKYGSHKTVLQPVLAKNLQWRKPKFGKQKTEHLNLLKSIETSDPFSFEEIKEALLPVCPKAVVFQGQKDISPDDIFHVDVSTSAPPPLCDMLYICKSQTEIKSVLESFSDENVKLIAESTVGQSDNNLWASHRKCRITSSFVHDVFTRINSLKSGKRGDNITSVLMKILHSESFDYKKVPQLKYGIEMESEAKMSYTKFMLSSGHSNFCVLNVGLIVLQDKPQYGASPDGIVSCSCCQDGLVEIKCPMSIAHTCPSESNLPYLVNIGELCSLKKTHKYYSQIQWQMGISHLPWCDFFVYTRHGHFLERIPFDEKHFKNIICNCDQFYSEFVIPTILNKSGDYNIDVQVDVHNISDAEYDVHNISDAEYDIHNISDAEYDNYMKITKPITNQVNPPCKRRKTKHSPLPIYLCEICLNVCVSEDSIDNSDCNSVLCDKCLLWYHFKCVDYIDGSEDEWFCPNCK